MHKEKVYADSIFTIHDFLSPEECEEYIDLSEQTGYSEAPITTRAGFVMQKDVRNNERVMVDDVMMAADLFALARPHLPAKIGDWELVGLNERFRFYRYDVGQTFVKHYDGCFRRDNGEESLLTFMVYLNDGYEGGTTEFYKDDDRPKASIHPKQGMALVFQHVQLHEGATVTAGRKYVLRTDVMYRRTR